MGHIKVRKCTKLGRSKTPPNLTALKGWSFIKMKLKMVLKVFIVFFEQK